jgi:hypothetical protein
LQARLGNGVSAAKTTAKATVLGTATIKTSWIRARNGVKNSIIVPVRGVAVQRDNI